MVMYGIVEGAELILDALALAANALLAILPNAALGSPNVSTGVLATLNYFVPVVELSAALTVVMTAWVIYRIYQWGLRWAKVAD